MSSNLEKNPEDSAIAERDNARSATFAIKDSDARELLLSGFASTQRRVDEHLRLILGSQGDADCLLLQGMRVGSLEGGKRVRPFLLFASAQLVKAMAQEATMESEMKSVGASSGKTTGQTLQAFEQLGVGSRLADDAAAALELVHSYSLVHDDLPSMDGDLLRRGKPTVHVRFGEGQAILVGDALLTLAFEVLASAAFSLDCRASCIESRAESRLESLSVAARESGLRLALIKCLATAAGTRGLVGGQSLDLVYSDKGADNEGDGKAGAEPSNKRVNKLGSKKRVSLSGATSFSCSDESLVRLIHARKTGALLRASCAMGACCEGASDELRVALDGYGRVIGEAYQIVDDLCDFANPSSSPSSSSSLSPCYVSAVGKVAAENRVRALCSGAEASIIAFGDAALPLVLFARFLPSRIPSSLMSPISASTSVRRD